MSNLLYKFDDFIDLIVGKIKPLFDKAISLIFMPRNITDALIRCFLLIACIFALYAKTFIPISKDFSDKKIKSTLISVKIGVIGSGNVRFSGNAEYYYFKLNGYRCTFFMTNQGSFLGEGLLSRKLFKTGNLIETTITKTDYHRLFNEIPLSDIKSRKFPKQEDCVRAYGITVNGHIINSKYASLFSVSYFNNFGWIIPLYIYLFVLMAGFGVLLYSIYINWKSKKVKS